MENNIETLKNCIYLFEITKLVSSKNFVKQSFPKISDKDKSVNPAIINAALYHITDENIAKRYEELLIHHTANTLSNRHLESLQESLHEYKVFTNKDLEKFSSQENKQTKILNDFNLLCKNVNLEKIASDCVYYLLRNGNPDEIEIKYLKEFENKNSVYKSITTDLKNEIEKNDLPAETISRIKFMCYVLTKNEQYIKDNEIPLIIDFKQN